MIHAWRGFRRSIRTGHANIPDLEETVRRTADQGFFLEPAFRRRIGNQAELLLLVDQEGSMAPFHWLTRELVDTAREEGRIGTLGTYYFHDVFHEHVFERATLLRPHPFERIMAGFAPKCGVLIVSDGGAARGSLDVEDRIMPTLRMIARLRRHTPFLAWLNPMPQRRWENTSARYIAEAVPMFPMTADGLSRSIGLLRGLGGGGNT